MTAVVTTIIDAVQQPLHSVGRTLFVIAAVLATGWMVDHNRPPAGDIYQAGYDVGFGKGYDEGRAAVRPVVVQINRARGDAHVSCVARDDR
jgi:hypothetical protein